MGVHLDKGIEGRDPDGRWDARPITLLHSLPASLERSTAFPHFVHVEALAREPLDGANQIVKLCDQVIRFRPGLPLRSRRSRPG
jgi:hypothetical protein